MNKMGQEKSTEYLVGIGEMRVSNRENERLAAYALGSCIGLSLYDPVTRIGGLVHCMLPLSEKSLPATRNRPCDFVDAGIKRLLQAVINRGASEHDLIVCAAGGASFLKGSGLSDIGTRNCAALRKTLWEMGLLIAAKDVGGNLPRTMILDMSTGETRLRRGGKEWILKRNAPSLS